MIRRMLFEKYVYLLTYKFSMHTCAILSNSYILLNIKMFYFYFPDYNKEFPSRACLEPVRRMAGNSRDSKGGHMQSQRIELFSLYTVEYHN